ncbi:hypothetical protein WA026_019436 [Henosepilachna vigintioctopunctata]|uniref:Uncharacterized protein n=1 Tax=Henosepilachna vigintioctopunctata TaxID=420089 RepID=A0AAW1UCW2_9CUCU
MQDIINLEMEQRKNENENGFKTVKYKKNRIKPKLGEGVKLSSSYEYFQSKYGKKPEDEKIWLLLPRIRLSLILLTRILANVLIQTLQK